MPALPASEALGWVAAALMVCTFSCREPRAMRPLAVATNLLFIAYGAAASLSPVLALHALLLPINLWRWKEHMRASGGPCLGARGRIVAAAAGLLLIASGDARAICHLM